MDILFPCCGGLSFVAQRDAQGALVVVVQSSRFVCGAWGAWRFGWHLSRRSAVDAVIHTDNKGQRRVDALASRVLLLLCHGDGALATTRALRVLEHPATQRNWHVKYSRQNRLMMRILRTKRRRRRTQTS